MPHDVVVIGAGITGAGVARDCAMRGLKTLVLERAAAGGATTASSSHLIHGGLRYLLYDRLTTHTTSWDSGHIVRIARPLLTRLPILWPVYRGHAHGIETVETLMEAYDRFSAMKGGRPHLRLSAEAAARLAPGLAAEGLLGAVTFDEWWVDPVGLVRQVLESARRHGAEALEGTGATGLAMDGRRVVGVVAGGRRHEARVVVNASGPWIDSIARMAGLSIRLRLQKGTHLVYRERLSPVGLLLEAQDRARYVFVLPNDGGTLLGPTDLPAAPEPDRVRTDESEVGYLLGSVRRYFPSWPASHAGTTVGARPILGQAGAEKLLSREFEIFDHAERDGVEGFVTVGGGKMSDFRFMSESTTNVVCRKLGVPAACRTHLEALTGEPVPAAQAQPRPARWLRRLLRRQPRLREAHAFAYLGGAYLRHWARRLSRGPAACDAESFVRHYAGGS